MVRDTSDVFWQHQVKIAKRTMELSEAGAMILGGMNHEEAREILRLDALRTKSARKPQKRKTKK